MPAIVFPVSSAPGVHQQEGSGRLVNCRAVKTDQGARAPFKWEGQPGLRFAFEANGAYVHSRGAIVIGGTLLVVLDTRVQAVTKAGTVYTVTDLGELPGTDLVTIARDNSATPKIMAVCDAGSFNLFVDSAPTSFADGDWPSVNSVTGMNGYRIGTTGSGQIWSTDLNSNNVQNDAFTTAQMNPDGLLRGVAINGEFLAMGTNSIEAYEEVGTTPFPLQFKKIIIQPGLIATHAVAGFEDGWANKLFYVASDFTVRRLDGYTPSIISNDDVSRDIKSAADKSMIEASVYMDGGHAFLVITSPNEWTWEYNFSTGQWGERESNGRPDWRARRSIRAFDEWIVGDDLTGQFATIDPTYMREYDDPLIWMLESGHNAAFPQRVALPRADFDFIAALGEAAGSDPIETDPKVMISWSLDGGYSWGNEITRSLGAQGKSKQHVNVNRLGLSQGKGIRFRLRISDPVRRSFMGGVLTAPEARAA